MHKSTFDDEQLEKLLQSMPMVKDTQDPEQLFAKISSRLEEELPIDKKIENKKLVQKKRPWILPTLASIAAVVIIALVVPSFLHEQESALDEPTQQLKKETIEDDVERNAENFPMMAEEGPAIKMAVVNPSHVITEVLENEEIITVAVPDTNAQFVVPLSFRAPKDEAISRLERVETINDHLHEEEWGLSSYILENVTLSEGNNGKKLIIDVPADHQYGNGSAMEVIFLATVKVIAKQLGYGIIEFRTEGNQGIVLGNYGKLTTIDLQKEKTKGVYYVFEPNGAGQKFLVPLPMDVEFSKAIEAMKVPNDIEKQQITPAIAVDINFQKIVIEENNKSALIEFVEGTNLVNDETSALMIEAILMTAKEYGVKTVEFKNAGPDYIGPYNLLEPVQVPLAVNPMPY